MSAATSIEWTDATWNPTTGCDRISPGCDHCYALTMAGRLKAMGSARYQNDGDPRTSGPGFGITCHPDALGAPLRWRKPRRVFVNSMSDLFHEDVPDDFIAAVVQVMTVAKQHTFQVLTKRPQRMRKLLARISWDLNGDSCLNRFTATEIGAAGHEAYDFGVNLPNVWWGTTIEGPRWMFRARHLSATPAAVRFWSVEPYIEYIPDFALHVGMLLPDWVIVGGESGRGARPMPTLWAREVVGACHEFEVPVFVKQLGTVAGGRQHQDIKTFPPELRVREWPSGSEET